MDKRHHITLSEKQHLTEEELRKSEEKYRRIFENVQDGYFEVSFDGLILEVSPSIGMISNGQYCREDLVGKRMTDFYADPQERQAYLEALMRKGQLVDYEVSLKNLDGSFIPCAISSKITLTDDGKPEKMVGSIRNISERKQILSELIAAKDKAEESSRLKAAFLNNMSHEIRTPMNAIMGFAELLLEAEPEDKNRYAAFVHQGTNQLLNLIDNVVLLSRMQSEKLPLNCSTVQPSSLIHSVCQMFSLPETRHNLTLIEITPDNSRDFGIRADGDKISKVLTNLLTNAVKYTNEGSVETGFMVKGNEVEFYVSDTGIGIPESEQEKIFEVFYRSNQVVSAAIRGTGLGLNISRVLVELMGGRMGLESSPGQGSRFWFCIPVQPPAE